jgi:hypothetical protein
MCAECGEEEVDCKECGCCFACCECGEEEEDDDGVGEEEE